ncbi:MAG: M48 family metalloprotease [Planctomycetota bacterium]|nr:M48 family metalloprotease [Planctomycetota bacterium]
MNARTLLIACLAALPALLGACTTNPTTGRSQLALLSREDEIKMGREYGPQFTQESGGEVKDPRLQAYVSEIGNKLVQHVVEEDKALPWKFTLLDSDVINAFALPGGQVFMSRGLASKMTNEAQLAGVLGHEIGHVTARHINEQMGRQRVASGGSLLAALVLGEDLGGLAQQGAGLVLLKYGRDQESEADALGMRYMVQENYNPIAQRQVMEILQGAMSGADRPGEFFSTHPYPETRIDRINNALAGDLAYTQNNPQFQLHEERFRQRFLSLLAALPPAPDARHALASSNLPHGNLSADSGSSSSISLGVWRPEPIWCGLCREH